MNELLKVEEKYGFKLPGPYRAFADHGYFTYPGEDYLWVHEAEWLPVPDMLESGGFWGNPKPGLVAFAFSGRRDLWAWQTQLLSEYGEPMIAFCPRDCFEGEWYAPCFLGWLYRNSLEYACSMWDDELETKQNICRWASVLRQFDQIDWGNFLESVASRQVSTNLIGPQDNHTQDSLISAKEVDEHVALVFGPGFVNSPYIWDLDGERGG